MDDYLASPDDRKQQASKSSVTFEANVNAGNYVEFIEYQRGLIEQLQARINDELKPLERQNQDAHMRLEAAQVRICSLETEHTAMNNEIATLKTEVDELRDECNALKEEGHLGVPQWSLRAHSASYSELHESH